MKLRVPPIVQVLVCVAIAWGARQAFPQFNFESPVGTYVAIALAAGGVLLLFLALHIFAEKQTTIDPIRPETAEHLVETGLYKFTRNPMYLGLLLIVSAAAIAFGNPISLLAPVLFVLAMNELQVKAEEAALREKFGSSYTAYCERVRRWI